MPVGPAVAPGAGGIAVRWGVIAYVGLLVAMPLAASKWVRKTGFIER